MHKAKPGDRVRIQYCRLPERAAAPGGTDRQKTVEFTVGVGEVQTKGTAAKGTAAKGTAVKSATASPAMANSIGSASRSKSVSNAWQV
jgi:hypothetical protein